MAFFGVLGKVDCPLRLDTEKMAIIMIEIPELSIWNEI
jgi:hypothetical protein